MSCVFCNIAKGFEPATLRAQDDEFIAIDDLYPVAPTHLLVMPRAHHDHLDSWIAADRAAGGGASDRMLAFVANVAHETGIAGRYRLVTNVGRDAGQAIPHLHWHVMAGDLAAF